LIFSRCFAWDERARSRSPGGPLWFPRELQGDGRHDNPDVYGCLYVSEAEQSAIAEQLARFRGSPFHPGMLRRHELPLAMAAIELSDDRVLIDLDDASTLVREELQPSVVATYDRAITQPQALRLFRKHPDAAGLRWWSTHEALWVNVTLFDRARTSLRVADMRELTAADRAVQAATEFLGLAP
jgi:hypothetical protein